MDSAPQDKPLLVFDGDCGFCRGWVQRWRSRTGDEVDYQPYQQLEDPFRNVTHADFARQAYLFDADGSVYRGAGAVFRNLSFVPGREIPLWCYEHVPGVRWVANAGYRVVAGHRRSISALTRIFWGDHSIAPSYGLVRSVFLRLLGVVYLIAFVSLAVQITTLVGKDGISPAADFLQFVHQRIPDDAYWRVPTLFWFNVSDQALVWMCWAGAAVSLLLVVGVAPVLTTGALWVMYLSLVSVGDVFLQFQWDNLLLEAGLLAIFFSPPRLFLRASRGTPSWIFLWLYRWLIFRLMFLSGMVKLLSGQPNAWTNGTALNYHYWTQPLPHIGSWYIHQFPHWFHVTSLIVMFTIELVCPFLIFGPRRARQFAGLAFMFLMAVVAATGNYTFFNLLTAILALTLFDDQALRWLFRLPKTAPALARRKLRWIVARGLIHVPVGAFILVVSFCAGWQRLDYEFKIPQPIASAMRVVGPFRSINSYGLFARMTTSRPEIIIEGSNDGKTWKEYEFRWKPGDVKKAPRWVQPHQPRVDWQMWFAALGNYRQRSNYFVTKLMRRILEGSPEVLKLFSVNPFPNKPPRYLRAMRHEYTFSDPKTRAKTGAWWVRSDPRPYTPIMQRDRLPPHP